MSNDSYTGKARKIFFFHNDLNLQEQMDFFTQINFFNVNFLRFQRQTYVFRQSRITLMGQSKQDWPSKEKIWQLSQFKVPEIEANTFLVFVNQAHGKTGTQPSKSHYKRIPEQPHIPIVRLDVLVGQLRT